MAPMAIGRRSGRRLRGQRALDVYVFILMVLAPLGRVIGTGEPSLCTNLISCLTDSLSLINDSTRLPA